MELLIYSGGAEERQPYKVIDAGALVRETSRPLGSPQFLLDGTLAMDGLRYCVARSGRSGEEMTGGMVLRAGDVVVCW